MCCFSVGVNDGKTETEQDVSSKRNAVNIIHIFIRIFVNFAENIVYVVRFVHVF